MVEPDFEHLVNALHDADQGQRKRIAASPCVAKASTAVMTRGKSSQYENSFVDDVANELGDDVMKKIVGTSLDKPSEITALAAMDERERPNSKPCQPGVGCPMAWAC